MYMIRSNGKLEPIDLKEFYPECYMIRSTGDLSNSEIESLAAYLKKKLYSSGGFEVRSGHFYTTKPDTLARAMLICDAFLQGYNTAVWLPD